MQNKLEQIYNYFGSREQDLKQKEEFFEAIDAQGLYRVTPNKDNIEELLKEIYDLFILTQQIAICQYGLNLDEIQGYYDYKVYRTIKIINLMKTGMGYDQAKEYLERGIK